MKRFFLTFFILLFCLLPATSYAARLWSTGFELQSVTSGVEEGTITGSPTISTTIKRSGAASFRVNPSATTAYTTYTFSAGSPTVSHYFRFYLYIATAPAQNVEQIFLIQEDATNTASIRLNNNRTLELWNENAGGTAAQVGNDSSALDLDTWYRIELAFDYIGASDNVLTAYIDGVQFATGNDVGGTADQPFKLRLGAFSSQTSDLYFDDVAINDSNGAVQTGLPGAGSIVYLWPNAAGDTNTCNAGDYTSVDETPTPDDATSYAECDDAADILEVNAQDSSVAGINSYDTITLVQVGIRHVIDTSGTISLAPRIKSAAGGTTTTGTSFTHDDTTWRTNGDVLPQNYKLVSYTDPTTTAAWTPTGTNSLDNMQIGVIVTDATPDAWISTLWALVEYTAGTPPAGGRRIIFIQ